jgi:hypothetical protein
MDGVRFGVGRGRWDRVGGLTWRSLSIVGLDGGGCSPRRLVAFWLKSTTSCATVTDGGGVV